MNQLLLIDGVSVRQDYFRRYYFKALHLFESKFAEILTLHNSVH